MKKWTILLLIILAIPFVMGEICEDQIPVGSTCTLLTPTITNCSNYNYTIADIVGNIVESADLTVLEGNIYYFNFTQEEGGYIIELCDGSTREITVGMDDQMGWTAIVIAISVMTFIMILGAINIKEKKLEGLKALLFLLAITNGFILGMIPMAIALNVNDVSAFEPVTIGYFTFNAVCLIAFIWIYSMFLVRRSQEGWQDNK